jgi:hypothetical protein
MILNIIARRGAGVVARALDHEHKRRMPVRSAVVASRSAQQEDLRLHQGPVSSHAAPVTG